MKDIIGLILFVVISFVTGISLSFALLDHFFSEQKLFSSIRNAVLTYSCGIISAVLFTGLSVWIICRVQTIFH